MKMSLKQKVLFLCTNNSARSQMAEGLLRNSYGDFYESCSAGTDPTRMHRYAKKVMKEIGIDISKQYSKSLDEFIDQKFDYVIIVCDQTKESCPFFPGAKKTLHKSFEDPAKFQGSEAEILNVFRRVRDEIKVWIGETFQKTD